MALNPFGKKTPASATGTEAPTRKETISTFWLAPSPWKKTR